MTPKQTSGFGTSAWGPKRVFLVHFNESEARELASRISGLGLYVEFEAIDGGRAVKSVVAFNPNLVVISLSRLPSHGRATADGISSGKKTGHIPILFSGGNPEAVEKAKSSFPGAVCCREELLEPTVKHMLGLK